MPDLWNGKRSIFTGIRSGQDDLRETQQKRLDNFFRLFLCKKLYFVVYSIYSHVQMHEKGDVFYGKIK